MADLILGAGYIGARLAELAIESGREVVLADNWYATEREQLDGIGARATRYRAELARGRWQLPDHHASPAARLPTPRRDHRNDH